MGLPLQSSAGDSPSFLVTVFLIHLNARGNASGHFRPVSVQILASLVFKMKFFPSYSPTGLGVRGTMKLLFHLKGCTNFPHYLSEKMGPAR